MAIPQIMITLDVEECDIPTEYGIAMTLEEQLALSRKGVAHFMALMDELEIPVTIFCTGVYAENNAAWVRNLHPRHEIASHGYYHNAFDPLVDLQKSKDLLELLRGEPVTGFRMARMQYVPEDAILQAGYTYHSSMNPTWIPGRYDHRDQPVTMQKAFGLWTVPASVSTYFRIPLFWLAFKNFPLFVYQYLSRKAWAKTGFLNIYFHPWEFTDLSAYALPAHVKRGSAGGLLIKLNRYLTWLRGSNTVHFTTMRDYVKANGSEQ